MCFILLIFIAIILSKMYIAQTSPNHLNGVINAISSASFPLSFDVDTPSVTFATEISLNFNH